MKIKNDFILRKVGDTGAVVPVGQASREFDGMVTLNATGVFLWEHLQKKTTREALIAALTAEYEVDPQVASADVDAFLQNAKDAGLLVE